MIEVLVKCLSIVNANPQDFRIKVDENISVQDLKRLLSKEHPFRPSLEDQRLVSLGAILEDEETLKNIIPKVLKHNHLDIFKFFRMNILMDQQDWLYIWFCDVRLLKVRKGVKKKRS